MSSSSLCGWLIEPKLEIGKILANFETTLLKLHYSILKIKKEIQNALCFQKWSLTCMYIIIDTTFLILFYHEQLIQHLEISTIFFLSRL